MNTDSLASIFFNPIFICSLVLGLCIVFYFESDRERSARLLQTAWKHLMSFPYVILVLKVFPVINNSMVLLGFPAPVSWLRIFGDNLFMLMIAFAIVASMLIIPVVNIYVRRRYSPVHHG